MNAAERTSSAEMPVFGTSSSRPSREGKIITFYSYKGGTGRSMAVSNVAWVLASAGRRVLLVDWDLEAPGIHRYLRPFLLDPELSSSEGLIDFFTEYVDEALRPRGSDGTAAGNWYEEYADISRYALAVDWSFPGGGSLQLVGAGRQGATYATRVNAFDWQNFYDRLGGHGFLEAVRAGMRRAYDFVLIDSRTGVSDTSGICTVQMPDALVLCFMLNNQSIDGASAVARSVCGQRSATPQFRVWPVPTRVEQSETDRRDLRRSLARRAFDWFLPAEIDHMRYWGEVELPYMPYFAYEEVLAAFKEDPRDPKLLLAAVVRLTRYLTNGEGNELLLPIESELRQKVLTAFAGPTEELTAVLATPQEDVSGRDERQAEDALARLPEAQRIAVLRVIERLVRVPPEDEPDDNFGRLRMTMDELGPEAPQLLGPFLEAGIVRSVPGLPDRLELANGRIVRSWTRLRSELQDPARRPFLLWRQDVRQAMATRQPLPSDARASAVHWTTSSGVNLTEAERRFVANSLRGARRQRFVAGFVAVVIVLGLGWAGIVGLSARSAALRAPTLADVRAAASPVGAEARAEELSTNLVDPRDPQLLLAWSSVAERWAARGDPARAARLLQKAYETALANHALADVPMPETMAAAGQLGSLQLRTGDAAAALRTFAALVPAARGQLRAASGRDETPEKRRLAEALAGQADALAAMGDKEALERYDEAIALGRELGDTRQQAALRKRATAFFLTLGSAGKDNREQLEALLGRPGIPDRASMLEWRADCRRLDHELDRAINDYDAALEIVDGAADTDRAVAVPLMMKLAGALAASGAPAVALDRYQEAFDLLLAQDYPDFGRMEQILREISQVSRERAKQLVPLVAWKRRNPKGPAPDRVNALLPKRNMD